MNNAPDAITLFSGGLDSLLAAVLLRKQGLNVLCVHFHTPFFGSRDKVEEWRKSYDLNVELVDLSLPYMKMLLEGPEHGFGKHLNPCVDCKILQLSTARGIMGERGAKLIATGEVPGQRPMSQRRDSLNLIEKCAKVRGLLLRPLAAKAFPAMEAERQNLIKSECLPSFYGRNRTPQLTLARELGLNPIPSPAGGCLLTEMENSRRYWQILKGHRMASSPDFSLMARDFDLANTGRQFWHKDGGFWLIIGRNSADNQRLLATADSEDLHLRLADLPGPVGLARRGASWPEHILRQACELVASYSTRANEAGRQARMRLLGGDGTRIWGIIPKRDLQTWQVPEWSQCRQEIRQN